MSLQRQFDRGQARAIGRKWPKGAALDARNEMLMEAGVTLHPTKGFRTRREWRDDATRRAAKGSRRGMIRRLLAYIGVRS